MIASQVRLPLAALLAIGALLWAPARAEVHGVTAEGRPFASGGIGLEEREQLSARRKSYSLWVTTAAARSGAMVAEARVSIVGGSGKVVFDGAIDGPWLFIDLAPGRYKISATYEGQTQNATTTIHPGDHHQVMLYFETPADVLPREERPAGVNPYAGG
jgi:hypothetical protein